MKDHYRFNVQLVIAVVPKRFFLLILIAKSTHNPKGQSLRSKELI